MELPIFIKQKIEDIASSYSIKDLKKSVDETSKKYLSNSSNGEDLVASKIDCVGYAITRMPATYAALSEVLEELFEFDNNIKTIIDIGSGTGNSVIAINQLNEQIKITCFEKEKEMISLANSILNSFSNYDIINLNIVKDDINNSADLIISSYMLNEIKENELNKVLEKIYNSSNKYIVIVEPGTPNAYLKIQKIKEYFINKGSYVLAPCPHMGKCQICSPDWCHFQVRLSRSKLHKLVKNADVPFEDEKYTYLIISKEKKDVNYSRILSRPTILNGRVELKTCTKCGEIKTTTITKKDKDSYKKVRKLNSGDKF